MDAIDTVLRKTFAYDPETGIITRLVSKRTDRVGKPAGCPESHGYLQIRFQGRLLMAHLIAWALFYGVWPDHEVDHNNRNRSDNRIKNLRRATRSQNNANSSVRKDNELRIRGVKKIGGRFVARLAHGKRLEYLGSFDTAEEASRAFNEAHRVIHGKFAGE